MWFASGIVVLMVCVAVATYGLDTHCPSCGAWMSRRAWICRCCGSHR
jgi:hypothetical protein